MCAGDLTGARKTSSARSFRVGLLAPSPGTYLTRGPNRFPTSHKQQDAGVNQVPRRESSRKRGGERPHGVTPLRIHQEGVHAPRTAQRPSAQLTHGACTRELVHRRARHAEAGRLLPCRAQLLPQAGLRTSRPALGGLHPGPRRGASLLRRHPHWWQGKRLSDTPTQEKPARQAQEAAQSAPCGRGQALWAGFSSRKIKYVLTADNVQSKRGTSPITCHLPLKRLPAS